uniref:DNA polymerase epsilon subunit 2 n=1 Tax=Apteryx owenii TaxID=8824 RepID=A0A8B9NYQ8_APTOW
MKTVTQSSEKVKPMHERERTTKQHAAALRSPANSPDPGAGKTWTRPIQGANEAWQGETSRAASRANGTHAWKQAPVVTRNGPRRASATPRGLGSKKISWDAINYLTEALQSINEVELEDVIENIIDAVEKQPLSSNMIEQSTVEAAVQECSQALDETVYGDIIFYMIFMGVGMHSLISSRE